MEDNELTIDSFAGGGGASLGIAWATGRAQGFPDTYELTGTKTNQVAKIGNSVCPHVAAAVVRANVGAELFA